MLLSLLAIASSGCLATKGDIRLLQDEIRATRGQVSQVDTSVIRANTQLRQQITTLSSELLRLSDSVRIQASRLASMQATTNGELNAMNGQIVQMQALLNQSTRTIQETRERLNALREAASSAPPTPVAPMSAGDTSRHVPPNLPGSATLYITGKETLQNGAFTTARNTFEQLLSAYPNSIEAPSAQFQIGQSYTSEGNNAAADSVYQLVYTRYPKSTDAPTAMYRHGTFLWDANKKPEARSILNRVTNEYPNSDAAALVKSFLRDRDR